MTEQLSYFPKRTVAQAVYAMCWEHYMNQSATFGSWNRVIEAVSKETGIDEKLVRRIVKVQSKWIARRTLRRAQLDKV